MLLIWTVFWNDSICFSQCSQLKVTQEPRAKKGRRNQSMELKKEVSNLNYYVCRDSQVQKGWNFNRHSFGFCHLLLILQYWSWKFQPHSLVLLANKHNPTSHMQATSVIVVIFCMMNKSTVSLRHIFFLKTNSGYVLSL